MRELLKKDQIVTIVPHDFKDTNKGKVTEVSMQGFKMKLKYVPRGLMQRHICDFYSLTITRGGQQADTGTKMLHLGNGTISNIVSYGVALDSSRQTFRSLVSFSGTHSKNASKCDTRIIGNKAIVNTLPTIIHSNGENEQSHEATTGTIDKTQLLFLMEAGISEDEATALIIGAVAAPIISRLPMEFLVESKQLIKMALGKE